MKHIKIQSLGMAILMTAMTACDDNAWNDKLEGFDGNEAITDMQTIEYTLTAADYAAIAANSTNVSLAGADKTAALKAVGTQQCFTEEIPASEYVPAFLASTSFPYFTLSNGSAIKLTYNVWKGYSEEIAGIKGASQYAISDADYQYYVWESDDDYIAAFAPSKQPASYINKILKDYYDDAQEGDYVVVNYEMADQEPIFATPDTPATPNEFVMSDVLGHVQVGDNVTANAVVTAKCTRGMIVTDQSGSILFYNAAFDYDAYAIGDQLVINAEVSSYGKALQLVGTSAVVEKVDSETYSYPAPVVYDGAAMDEAVARTTDENAVYAQFTGTAVVGNYINFTIEGAETAQGSAYYTPDDIKNQLADGEEYVVTGYFVGVSSSRYFNVVVTNVAPKGAAKAPIVAVPTTNVSAVYQFNGTKWAEPAGVVVLQAADYTAMGQSYGNLSNNQPAELLPIYLKQKYPYAQAEDTKYVVYKYYASGATTIACDEYKCDGTQWVKYSGIESETSQFVRNAGKWNYDPSVTVVLPAGKSQQPSTAYFQACVDWVYYNIDVPLGSTSITSGIGYVTSYGNNEYYSGSSAYQGNVDIRGAKAKEQYPDGYEGLTDDQITELMKRRFAFEVLPGALKTLHADAVPVPGIDVTYTITFGTYDGSNSTETIRYRVVGPAEFEFIDCTWWEEGIIPR